MKPVSFPCYLLNLTCHTCQCPSCSVTRSSKLMCVLSPESLYFLSSSHTMSNILRQVYSSTSSCLHIIASPNQWWLLWDGCQHSFGRFDANWGCTCTDLQWSSFDGSGCCLHSWLYRCIFGNFRGKSQESSGWKHYISLWILGGEDHDHIHQPWHVLWSFQEPFVCHVWSSSDHD